MVAVHPHGPPACSVKVAARKQPSGMQEEKQFAESAVGKENTEPFQFRFREDSAAWNIIEDFGHRVPRGIVENPESRHSGIENSQIILRHAQRELFKVLEQIVFLANRSHPVV